MLVLNGDTLFELDLEALCAFHQRRQAAATLVLRKDPDAARWGVVEVESDDRIVRITGRGRTDAAATSPGCLLASIFSIRVCCVMCPRASRRPSSMHTLRRSSAGTWWRV